MGDEWNGVVRMQFRSAADLRTGAERLRGFAVDIEGRHSRLELHNPHLEQDAPGFREAPRDPTVR